jgi:hypothetical protein
VFTSDQCPRLEAFVGFDFLPNDPFVRVSSGVLPKTGEHPDIPVSSPWLFIIPVGLAGIAFILGRRRQIA